MIADGLQEGTDAEVSGLAYDAVGGAGDEVEGVVGEGVVSETDAIELGKDEGLGVIGGEFLDDDGIGDAGLDVLVDGEVDGVEKGGLIDEDEVVIFGEVLEEEAEFSQAQDVHEMRVINDGDDHFAEVVEAEGLLNETLFATKVAAAEINLKRLA